MFKYLLLIAMAVLLTGCNDKQITEKYLSGNWECKYSEYKLTLFNPDGSIKSKNDQPLDQIIKQSFSLDDGILYVNLDRKRVATSLKKLRHNTFKQSDGSESESQSEFTYISDNEFERVYQFKILPKTKDFGGFTINSKERCMRVE